MPLPLVGWVPNDRVGGTITLLRQDFTITVGHDWLAIGRQLHRGGARHPLDIERSRRATHVDVDAIPHSLANRPIGSLHDFVIGHRRAGADAFLILELGGSAVIASAAKRGLHENSTCRRGFCERVCLLCLCADFRCNYRACDRCFGRGDSGSGRYSDQYQYQRGPQRG